MAGANGPSFPGERYLDRKPQDPAAQGRARGWAVLCTLSGIHIGHAGVHGRPGGEPTWGPPAHTALQRLTTSVHQ
ncbi:hypothetical protein ACFXBB_23325 [Streptomyces scopuliridis]|uniref:hypothetical protein n=1 Tax=Streptomyces scopuliridis TaxID=452529 RepID=UPI0036BDD58D